MSNRLSTILFSAILSAASLLPVGTVRMLHAQTPAAEPATSPVTAADDSEARQREQVDKLVKSLNYQHGTITLNNGLAKLNLPPTFRYLNPGDANKVLHNLWGNPPQTEILGLLLPSDLGPDDPACWAVVISYEEEGYVKDDDADHINYSDLMAKMKKGTAEVNKQRVAEGYPRMELVGWATPPRYDKATKKMYWAKELKTDGAEENSLNYNIRILGRRGVLVLNAVGGMTQLGDIEKATPDILSMVDFNEGHRYVDFNPKTDKVAAYGLAALVAGGVAMKLGLFKGLLVALLAAKKLVVIAVVAVAAFVKKLFNAGRENRS